MEQDKWIKSVRSASDILNCPSLENEVHELRAPSPLQHSTSDDEFTQESYDTIEDRGGVTGYGGVINDTIPTISSGSGTIDTRYTESPSPDMKESRAARTHSTGETDRDREMNPSPKDREQRYNGKAEDRGRDRDARPDTMFDIFFRSEERKSSLLRGMSIGIVTLEDCRFIP